MKKYSWIFAIVSFLGAIILFLDGIGQVFTFQTNIIFKIFEVLSGVAIAIYLIMKGFH